MANKVYVKEGVGFEGISMMQEEKSNVTKILILIVGTVIILGVVGFGASAFFGSSNEALSPTPGITILPTSSREPSNTPEPTTSENVSVTPTKKLTPSVTPKLSPTKSGTPSVTSTQKKGTLQISVLNGSGTRGAAKAVSDILTDAGFTVVDTGNADAFTYDGVTITIKNSRKQELEALKKALTTNNYLITSTKTTLEESSSEDAEVIVGAE